MTDRYIPQGLEGSVADLRAKRIGYFAGTVSGVVPQRTDR